MNNLINQNSRSIGLVLSNLPTMLPETAWTNTPNTIKQIRIDKKPGVLILYLTIKGLLKNNFKVSIAGNIVMIDLEKKRDLVISSSWGNRSHVQKSEQLRYSIYERSDVFLPGNNRNILKSARFIGNELVVKIVSVKREIIMQE
jgi:hypothetical protein